MATVISEEDKQKKAKGNCSLPISCADCQALSAEFGKNALGIAIAVLGLFGLEVSAEKIRKFIKNNDL